MVERAKKMGEKKTCYGVSFLHTYTLDGGTMLPHPEGEQKCLKQLKI